MAALAGGPAHNAKFICCGDAGVSSGAMLLETMSKMPAFVRSLKSVLSKVALSAREVASVEAALKLATAKRMRDAPRLVPVRTQSCAPAPQQLRGSSRRMRGKTREWRYKSFFLALML